MQFYKPKKRPPTHQDHRRRCLLDRLHTGCRSSSRCSDLAVMAGFDLHQAAALSFSRNQRLLLPRLRRYKGSSRAFKRPYSARGILSSDSSLWSCHIPMFYDNANHRTRQQKALLYRHALSQHLRMDCRRAHYQQLYTKKYHA